MYRSRDDWSKPIAGVAITVFAIVGLVALIQRDRYERDLVAQGHCTKILEALYTPPPHASTSCHGSGTSRWCSTNFHQRDPYMRSLWRCTDPEESTRVEFWRRTIEESAK